MRQIARARTSWRHFYSKMVALVAVAVTLLTVATDVRADWYAAYSGGPNHGADAYGAAADSFYYAYGGLPGIVLDGPCGITINPWGHPAESCVYGHAGSSTYHGYGSNQCPVATFATLRAARKVRPAIRAAAYARRR